MTDKLDGLREVLLMGPGPSCVWPRVYQALARPTIGHLDPYFIGIMDEIKTLTQRVYQTRNRITFPISGTGSAGMEACIANLVEPGDKILVLINGVFGKRMADVARRYGGDVDALEFDWGTPVRVDRVQQKLAQSEYGLVAMVHAETSTGVANPAERVGELVKEHGALYLLDTVTSLGGMPVHIDQWGVDAVYSGTQKCLSCPPGLSPISFSERAVEKLENRASRVTSWYLDLTLIVNYWAGQKRAYHHTAPINMLYGLYAALNCVLDEGLENALARHQKTHEQLVSGLADLGLEMLVQPDSRLPMLNTVKVPERVDEAAVRAGLLDEHAIEIGAGLGPLAGKVWRIGLMGHTARPENVDRLLQALAAILKKQSSGA